MAVVNVAIANPTAANVTVNAQVAVARKTTVLALDDTTADAYGFLAAGCALVSTSAQADLSKRTEAVHRLTRSMHLG